MPQSFSRWLQALKSGDDAAVDELWNLFYVRLCRRVAKSSKSLRWFDQEDIALDALVDVCDLLKQGQFQQLSTVEDLWKLLATIAVRRTCDRQRYERAACRGGSVQTLSFQDVADLPKKTNELSESQVTQFISELLDADDTNALAVVVRLRLEGLSNQEIADRRGCSVRKVQYMIEGLTNRLSGIAGGGDIPLGSTANRDELEHLAEYSLS